MKVLDTSVVYKWYVEEAGSERARAILNGFLNGEEELSVPDLLLYELANALRYNKQNTANDISDVLANFANLDLDVVVVTTGLLSEAVRLAKEHGVTVYDAVYTVLAQSLNCPMVTADQKLQRKLASLRFVHLL